MKKMYSLQMENNCYADDFYTCSSPYSMYNYCLKHDIFVDGLKNRIALISVDIDGYVDFVHELYRINYSSDSSCYLIPVNFDGADK